VPFLSITPEIPSGRAKQFPARRLVFFSFGLAGEAVLRPRDRLKTVEGNLPVTAQTDSVRAKDDAVPRRLNLAQQPELLRQRLGRRLSLGRQKLRIKLVGGPFDHYLVASHKGAQQLSGASLQYRVQCLHIQVFHEVLFHLLTVWT